jgi:prepilin-type N-terminal cleavage/methylation domain-containing protein
MKGGKNRHSDGYTILEVMIVLAISALLFLMAASFINGKQSSTSFTTGVAQFSSNLQGVLDQVTNGQYSDVPLQCTYSGSGLNITTKPSDTGDVSPDQGTNPQCVFLGKMVHFTGDLPTTGYTVYSIAGARLLPSGQPAIGLGGAMPTAV